MTDHHLLIRSALRGQWWIYLFAQVFIAYAIYQWLGPITGGIAKPEDITGTESFPRFMWNMAFFGLWVYVLFFLPIRVCGPDNLWGWLTAAMSVVVLNYFI